MPPDVYSASLFATVCAWLGAIPILLAASYGVVAAVFARPRREWILWFWLVAVLVTTPAPRQLLLLLVLAVSFPLQSISSFGNSIVAGLYAPVLFGLLTAISVALPLYALAAISGSNDSYRVSRALLAGLAAIPVFSFASLLFFPAAGLALRAVSWLDPVSIMRTADGPARYVFQYISASYAPVGRFLPEPEQDALVGTDSYDRLRIHMAVTLLDPQEQAAFVRSVYPRLYEVLASSE